MQLSPQNFAEVVGAIRATEQRYANSEQRRAPRLEVRTPVVIWPIVNGVPGKDFTALARDLSFAGIGLLQARKMAAGEQWVVGLSREKQEPLHVLCVARRVAEVADGLYTVGAVFLAVVSRLRLENAKSA